MFDVECNAQPGFAFLFGRTLRVANVNCRNLSGFRTSPVRWDAIPSTGGMVCRDIWEPDCVPYIPADGNQNPEI